MAVSFAPYAFHGHAHIIAYWSIACLLLTGLAWGSSGQPIDGPPALAAVAAEDDRCLSGQVSVAAFEGPLSPLEQQLLADAADRQFDRFSLFTAALVASGVDDIDALHRYEGCLAQWVDELRSSKELAGSPRHQAQVVFEFLHRRILRGGYRLEGTDLRRAIEEGSFNCVSASVLFQSLASEAGLEVVGLELPGHAMCRVALHQGALDVETTCPSWFQWLENPKKQAELAEISHRQSATADHSQIRPVSAIEMTAMIYYNRGIDLLAEQRFPEAAAANAKAIRLDPFSTTARGNLLATINNWAITLGNARRYSEAARLLLDGLSIDPKYETFTTNYVHLHRQWVEHLCEAGQYETALRVLGRAAVALPGRAYFQQAPAEVERRWAAALSGHGVHQP